MKKRIGELLVEKGLIHQGQVDQILAHSQKTGMRFGDSALDLGLIDKLQIARLFGAGQKADFFYLDPKFFPKKTKDFFTAETLIQFGVLPLGTKIRHRFLFFKQNTLNIGMISPDPKLLEQFKTHVAAKLREFHIQDLHVFLIIPDQFFSVLEGVYGLSDQKSHELAQNSLSKELAAISL